MRIRALVGTALVAVALTSSFAFGHQTIGNDPRNAAVKCGRNITTIGQHPNAAYLDVRDLQTGEVTGHEGEYGYNFWIYIESNNHPGLQTKAGSPHPVLGDIDSSAVENCSTALTGHTTVTTPDTFIF